MRVFAQVKLLSSEKESFTSDQGEYVEYHENILKGENGTITLNSKADFSENEGNEGVAEIEASELSPVSDQGGKVVKRGYKFTLKSFTVGAKIEAGEGVVE